MRLLIHFICLILRLLCWSRLIMTAVADHDAS